MSIGKNISGFFEKSASSLKSLAKMAIQSRRCDIKPVAAPGESLIVMGNGPSLADTMRDNAEALASHPLLAVNFAINAPEFLELRPEFYILADPVFFNDLTNANVRRLWDNFSSAVTWPLTLFVPAKVRIPVKTGANVTVRRFNPVGVEGFAWFENIAFRTGAGMPRPRNVLIPAIMTGIALGFKTIYIVGADHSWSKTLEVSDENVVISVQPHFYKDNEAEHTRVASVYKNIRLHEIMYSFYVAFRSYFTIRRFADSRGVTIYNSTPSSFIDAFPRRPLKGAS